ncbi:S8 family serine peptidase [Thetidibacter halocola]|uniref:S8 family serine peptidase n=1 Tax=Thetidibacter halocola TaxID=2827239 RepID=A0A8J7WHT9_9RHOB|nr:S8 family serine peptidase [Thetidibacter halocola]MBS0125901.1 S8 family serine peptidase [Thetidibacter halocola]
MARFTVLRDKASGGAAPGGTECDPCVEVAEIEPRDLRDLACDPGVLGIARSIPIRMITPQPMEDARPEDAVPGWGLAAIGGRRTVTEAVRLALLDTGIDRAHPAFAAARITAQDFVGSGLDDANGHGTHLAGTVLGALEGPIQLVLGKVVMDSGEGLSDRFLAALVWAAEQGACAIGYALTLDMGATVRMLRDEGQPETLAAAAATTLCHETLCLFARLRALLDRRHAARGGVLLVAAAGNDSRRTIAPGFEAGCVGLAAGAQVLAVGAVGPGLAVAPFSNTRPDLVAPGVGIVSAAAGGGTRALNGTSMAMAHALAAAGAWMPRARDAQALREMLLSRADPRGIGPHPGPFDCGAGLVRMPD